MRPLRWVLDLIVEPRDCDRLHWQPFEEQDVGWVSPPTLSERDRPQPALSDRERLMRHTGRPECPIPEHADALRRLGRMTMERDRWKERAEHAEEQLRHPSRGQAA